MPKLLDTPKHQGLVYDLGMHEGVDTDFYLKKGFRVIAFEANPELVADCGRRFKSFVDSGQLVIVEGAVVDPGTLAPGQNRVTFYVSDVMSVYGTASAEQSQRNEQVGLTSTPIEVDTVDLVEVIQRYGLPHYMKIDVEGASMLCLELLARFAERPDYLSVESDRDSLAAIRHELDVLGSLGYVEFQAVEQSYIHKVQVPPDPPREGTYVAGRFPRHSSGLFGLELDPTEWRSSRAIMRKYAIVRLGYYLIGDKGKLIGWRFNGADRIRWTISRFLKLFTKGQVPGWYDTHAGHQCVLVKGGPCRHAEHS
jgi:FkbM family methyltransferase